MSSRTILFLLTFAAARAASAQVDIQEFVTAEAYDPAYASDTFHAASEASWNAHGRFVEISASSDGQNQLYDPVGAYSKVSFDQPSYADATLRAISYAQSDYMAAHVTQGYLATTTFRSRHRLVIETGGELGGMYTYNLFLPMHGLVAVDDRADGESIAYAGSETVVRDLGGTILAHSSGSLDLTSQFGDDASLSVAGDWVGRVFPRQVKLPFTTAVPDEEVPGYELGGFVNLQLAELAGQSVLEFDVEYGLDTVARIDSNTDLFAVANFYGTGGFEIQAFDAAGNRFTDFTVHPAAVPEPASLAAISLGVAALLRRRRSLA